ncbi:CBBY-like protein isoform X2 [Lycium ferocissimum]|uniref:CBBY-like protein isoform X2 n=1 Tax=Lycium ferocissimum TaxID=112874 RepID=UPI002814E806|nr:CBBY-like protein isoform X2 [Lycium ferocissimum]
MALRIVYSSTIFSSQRKGASTLPSTLTLPNTNTALLSSSSRSSIERIKSASLRNKSRRNGVVTCSASPSSSVLPKALLFDCDGVLVDTEKDGHRISFNDTFAEKELGVTWDVDLYGELLKIGGGKERMTAYFNKEGWPENAPKTEGERKEFIAGLHKRKTELFMALIEKKLLPLRPGVEKLIDQALGNGVKVAVCSTSNEKAAIYLLAADTLGVDPSSCVVVEDSGIGVAAAKAAGMKCIVTKSGYTADENFSNADAVFDCIGDPPEERFDLAFCGSLVEKQYVS